MRFVFLFLAIGLLLSLPSKSADLVFRLKPSFRGILEDDRSEFRRLLAHMDWTVSRRFPGHFQPVEKTALLGYPTVDLSLLYRIAIPDPSRTSFTLRQIRSRPEVQWAEWEEADAQPQFMPNDPGADSTTGSQRLVLKKIQAYSAWALSQGDTNVLIGILDTGTPVDHEDLAPQIKKFGSDPPNGVDDDGNGYVDDFRGWDFGNNDNDPTPDNDGTVPGHGTSVASLAGAAFANGIGVAGVGGRCKILPLKIWRWNNGFSNFRGYDALVYAADRGCKVINCSWGTARNNRQFEQDIIDYVTLVKGCLVVSSGGNTPGNLNFLPANYNRVIGVSMTDENDQVFWAASRNFKLDLLAPGVNVWGIKTDRTYGWVEGGTSMASPMVAGAAGLVLSRFPDLNGLQAGELLRVNADTVYHLSPSNAGYRDQVGRGRLNIRKALDRVQRVSLRPVSLQARTPAGIEARAGDTVAIWVNFENYLDSVPGFSARLVSLDTALLVQEGEKSFSGLGTLKAREGEVPFRAIVHPGLTGPREMAVRIDVAVGSYTDRQLFTLRLNEDLVDLDANKVRISVASNGRLGFADGDNLRGSGILYKGVQYCGDAGWMLGTGPARLANCVYDTADVDNHFRSENPVGFVTWPGLDQHAVHHTNDSGAGVSRVGVRLKQSAFELAADSLSATVFLNLQVTNTQANTLDSLCVAQYTDWEVENLNRNSANWIDSLQLGYTFGQAFRRRFAATQVLSPGEPQFYAIDALPNTANGNINLFDGFSLAEKWQTMSRGIGRAQAGQGLGNNVVQVVGVKLRNLLPGETRKVTLAYVFADSLSGLIRQARANRAFFRNLQTSPSPVAKTREICLGDTLRGQFSLPGQIRNLAIYRDSVGGTALAQGNALAYAMASDSVVFAQGLDSLYPGNRTRQTFRIRPLPASGFLVLQGLANDTAILGSTVLLQALDSLGAWQWYAGDSVLADSTRRNLEFTPADTGAVTLCLQVTDSIGCGSRTCRTIWVKAPVANRNLLDSKRFRVFPNPARNITRLEADQPFLYHILDLQGQILETGQSKGTRAELNLGAFPPGVYAVQVQTAGKTEWLRLVVK